MISPTCETFHVPPENIFMKVYIFPFHPIYYPHTTLALHPSSNSDPGSHSGPSSPLPTTVHAFIFIGRRIQHFLPSSTRVEFYLPTLIFIFCSHFYFPASGQAVITGVVPSAPQFLPSIFIAHRVQQSHCSSIFHRALLTHALALSTSQFVHEKKVPTN